MTSKWTESIVEKQTPLVARKSETINNILSTLFNSDHLSDVTFNIRSDIIPAHRLILAARSDVFCAMFYGPAANANRNVDIEDIETNTFLLMLQYIYTDQVYILPKNVIALLYAAHKYNLIDLEYQCKKFIKSNLNALNAVRLYNDFLKIRGFFDVKGHIEHYICQNFYKRFNDHLILCSIEDGDALLQLVDNITAMKVKSNANDIQYKLFTMLIEWGTMNCKSEKQPCNGISIREKLIGFDDYLLPDDINEETLKKCIRYCPGFFTVEEIGKFSERFATEF